MNKVSQKIALASMSLAAMALSAKSAAAQGLNLNLDTAATQAQGFATNPQTVINTVVNIVFVVGAIIALAYLVMGGITWITSGGDKSKTEAARNKITAAIIGLLLLGAAYAIFMVILAILGVTPDQLLEIAPMTGS